MPFRSLAACLLLALTACAPALSPARPSARPVVPAARSHASTPPVSAADVEARVHARTNAVRRRAGLGALRADEALARVARRHSADMARRGFFDHTAPDGSDATARAARAGLTCRVQVRRRTMVGYAENLAQVWVHERWRDVRHGGRVTREYDWRTTDEVAAETVDGWMGSPGHRRNLLTDYVTREGVGVYIDREGAVFVTQMLC